MTASHTQRKTVFSRQLMIFISIQILRLESRNLKYPRHYKIVL
nr:MAG TPA: hypothetical protein [Bacteriophage sp.]